MMKHFIIASALCMAWNSYAFAEDDKNVSEEQQETDASDTSNSAGSNEGKQKTYSCVNGQGSQQMVRKVWITFGNEDGQDCEVHYAKETEEPGSAKVLWKAQQNPEYCQDKAQHLVDKLKGWGWKCSDKS